VFSSRLPSHLTTNAVTELVERLRRAGDTIDDLTETNPTAVGLTWPPELLEALAEPAAAIYRPNPRGAVEARAAIADTYPAVAAVAPDDILLTASTSEAYALLFKLLCDPGDAVLVPQPSYPLFDMLARLEATATQPYQLDPLAGWALDRDTVERAAGPRTRAVLVVSPNNPTGSIVKRADRDWLGEFAASAQLAIVADEVFADYPLSPGHEASSFAGDRTALTFTLGGLSKSLGLPQLKLAWIVVSGPPALRREALDRLEMIADTYLSVSTPVQLAAPTLIARGATVRDAIAARLRQNLEVLRGAVLRYPAITLVEPEGGWSVVLRVPATSSEEMLVITALERARVLVHPGFFFDFADEAFLVLSLLPHPTTFCSAVQRLLPVVAGVG
jgi:alanine-synthesizing transaminase